MCLNVFCALPERCCEVRISADDALHAHGARDLCTAMGKSQVFNIYIYMYIYIYIITITLTIIVIIVLVIIFMIIVMMIIITVKQ